jgi:hypothetical protein
MNAKNISETETPRKVARHLFRSEYGYYARMGIPVALRPIVGKRELWAAVHAETDAKAIRKLPAVVAGFQSIIDAARAEAKAERSAPRGRSLSPRQLAVAHYDTQMQFDNELRNTDSRYAHGFVDDRYVERLRAIISGVADNSEMRETLGTIARHYEARGHLKATFGTPEWREAARALAVAELESLARTAERDEGDYTGKPSNPILIEKPQPIVAKDDPLAVRNRCDDSAKTLGEVLPKFLNERKPSERTTRDYEVAVQLFEESLGDERPLYRITRGDMIIFKNTLLELPANHTKRFPGLGVQEAIKKNKARATPFEPLNEKTINNKYLCNVRSVLNWCADNEILPDSPTTGIRVVATKSTERKKTWFSPGDIARIFSVERFDRKKRFNET